MILRFFGVLLRLMRMYRDPVKYARSVGVQIGEGCRIISPEIGTFGSEPFLVRIGDHVTIGSDVRFITHDGGVWVFRQQHPDIDVFGPIIVGNNVFIGTNAILLPGVVIGDNCVIGAGAVVTRDIPSGCVAVGVPAKPIMSMDDYWEGVKTRALMIRSMSASEKRRYLEDHFMKR